MTNYKKIFILITAMLFITLGFHLSKPVEEASIGFSADKLLIEKKERKLTLFKNGQAVKTYRISLGDSPVGHKEREGDEKTPEGIYIIDNRLPESSFYKSLHISYPNKNDILNAERMGVSPGGFIMIHGLPNWFGWLGRLHLYFDWTDGCIAVTNHEIDEIWEAIPDDTIIEILP